MNGCQRTLLWGAVLAAALSAGGLGASTWVRSPAEAAAEARPPLPTVLTAGVVFEQLARNTIFRGTFTARGTVSFTAKTALAPDGFAGTHSVSPIVTAVRAKVGQRVRAGAVVAEIGYRPLFVLPGMVPALRDLAEGDAGPDVGQLQKGLAKAGFGRGSDALGTFGAGTASAVRRLYAASGYLVPTEPGSAMEGARDGTGAGARTAGSHRIVVMPASEVMYVAALPATIVQQTGRVGETAGSPLITLSAEGLRLQGRLDPGMKGAITVGQKVVVLDENTGKTRTGTVDTIGRLVTPNAEGNGRAPTDGGTPYIPVDITPTSGNWDADLADEDVRITASANLTHGRVLAVPEGAITTTANGAASVTVAGPDGRDRHVVVTPGVSADGLVAVTPAAGRTLKRGDHVVVGLR